MQPSVSSVSTAFKRLYVRYLLQTAEADEVTILSLLEAATTARITSTQAGKVLVSTSGNGHTATFALPEDFNAMDAAEMVSEIRDRYDEAITVLAEDDNEDPTNTQISTEIMAKLRPVRSVAADFSGLRYALSEVDD